MAATIMSVLGWIVWSLSLLIGVWFAFGIRQTVVQRVTPPTWPTLILAFALVAFPITFLFLPFSKLHIVWLLLVTHLLSLLAGIGYVPLLSQLLIWPAYIYTVALTIGTGVRPSSPSKQSALAAGNRGFPLRVVLSGWIEGFARKRSAEEKAVIQEIMQSRARKREED